MNDLINRQAAIGAIDAQTLTMYQNVKKGATYPKKEWFGGMANACEIIKALPSAKPDQCQDCALFDPNWRCGFWHRFTIPEGFCHNYKEREEEEKNDRIER